MEKLTLSTKKGSIAFALNEVLDKVNVMATDATTLQTMKSFLTETVMNINDKPIEKKSEGTKRILRDIARSRNKSDLLCFVYNAIAKADGFGA